MIAPSPMLLNFRLGTTGSAGLPRSASGFLPAFPESPAKHIASAWASGSHGSPGFQPAPEIAPLDSASSGTGTPVCAPLASDTATADSDAELTALRRDHAKLRQAIFEAAQMQRRLCAPGELPWRQFEVAGEIFPVRDLSGDFFKVLEVDETLTLVLGDIAGKGLTAGIWQPQMISLVHRCSRLHSDPAEAVAEMNRELCYQQGQAPLTALFFARLDPLTNLLVYCNAGLPTPLLLRANKTLERLDQGGPILGVMEAVEFRTGHVTLNTGDLLVAHSDGVTECRNEHGDEFEMDRLIAAARTVSDSKASKALFSLLATVLDFAGTRSPGDDLSLLLVRRRDAVKSEQSRSRKQDSATQRRCSSVSAPKSSARGGPSTK